jgi:2-keto-4-pentenoate hydratase/2-oxohepta-3-ene-1,7-dioic acid hydratase in catechol pathway
MSIATEERFVRYRVASPSSSSKIGESRLHEDGSLEVLSGLARLSDVTLLPPSEPSKIIGVGKNYRAHAREMGGDAPKEPLLFMMPSTAVIAHRDAIVRPSGFERVDFEGEFGVVIGKRARHVSAADAHEVIKGYTCVNDVTVRDLQKRDGQFTRAKGFDTFCPLGPCLATGLDADDLQLTTRVDGQVRQQARTSQMIFGVRMLIEVITRVMTLLPGDVIATGTPAGVGQAEVGSTIEVEIAGIGVLENHVVAED